jgi:GT2 family glycosyltransferase
VISHRHHHQTTNLLSQPAQLCTTDLDKVVITDNLAEHAAQKYVGSVNPDAYAQPQWLEHLLKATQTHPEFTVFGSKLVSALDPSVLDGTGDAYHLGGLIWRVTHGSKVVLGNEQDREIFSPCAAAAMYQLSAVFACGGFDENFFCYVEDVDLGFRMRLAGHRCLNVARSVAHHVGSGTTEGKHSDFALNHGNRNLVWTFVKNMHGILFWLLLPMQLLLNISSLVWFALRGRGNIIWRARKDALLGLPKMLENRNTLQQTRLATVADIWQPTNRRLYGIRDFKSPV